MSTNAERLTLEEKLELVKSSARIMGFRRHDLEDAVQEVMLAVIEFEYDPAMHNGGTETTALTTIIDRKLVSLKRVDRRDARIVERATDELAHECRGYDDGPRVEDRTTEKRIAQEELEATIADMDEEMQLVCRLLMTGMRTRGITRRLKMGWRRADELVAAIRERLEAAGFTAADSE